MMLLDTYAWIEFFRGTRKGIEVRKTLREARCCTAVVSLAEIVEWCLRNRLEARIGDYLKAVAKSSIVIGLDEETAAVAGRINHERKQKARGWGMVDSLILATAVSYNMNVLTGDVHFTDLPNARILSA
jgi:predicted nucleic acid-binding protein